MNISNAIAYSDTGEKGNPIILIHGLFDNKETWSWAAPYLNNHRLITPDLLGHGESNKESFSASIKKEGLTPNLHSECIRDLILQLDLNNFVIGGSSYGGSIALNTYIRYPEIRERTKGIVLIAAAGYQKYIPRYVRRMGGWLGYILQKHLIYKFCYKTGLIKNGVKQSIKRCFYDSNFVPIDLFDNLIRQLSDMRLIEGYHLTARCLIGLDFKIIQKQLYSVICPTLIIWGRQDQIIPPHNALYFARDLPNTEVAWIEDCGHAPHIEKAKQTGNCIKKFCDN